METKLFSTDDFDWQRPLRTGWLACSRLDRIRYVAKPADGFSDPRVAGWLSSVWHEGLPRFHGEVCAPDSTRCYLFDYLPGHDLRQWLDENPARQHSGQLLDLAVQWARILAFMHQQSSYPVMHLDIKPANLLVHGKGHACLIDFGSACIAQDTPLTGLSVHPRVLTPDYAAPEWINGQPVPASDIYALGLSILTALTGQPPDHCRSRPLAEQLPEGALQRVLNRCLRTDLRQRYRQADELACDLAAICLTGKDRSGRIPAPLFENRSNPDNVQQVIVDQPAPEPYVAAHKSAPLRVAESGAWPEYTATGSPISTVSPTSPASPTCTDSPASPTRTDSPASPAVLTCEHPRDEIDAGTHETENRPGVMPDKAEGRQERHPAPLLTVWDGPEFACELASCLAQNRQVLVIDANQLNPRADLLLGDGASGSRTWSSLLIQTSDRDWTGFDQLLQEETGSRLSPIMLDKLAVRTQIEGVRLLYGSRGLDGYEHSQLDAFHQMLQMSRLISDCVILLCHKAIFDAFTCLGLLLADQILVPLSADIGSFREVNRAAAYLEQRYTLDHNRLHYVAFSYNVRTDLSWGTMDELSGGRLAGCISERQNRRIMKCGARPYAAGMDRINQREYGRLIRKLLPDLMKEG